ncbi:LEA14-like dessication related protein [Pontibacter ummariensis]|uniref:LEA14-like dessication related protein n=1 Tax=Pontibacter ummariensis TaxID=1610492 RepID=A0A239G4Q6_9BACT|nr:LEA type 2 family protein [Pontibacter ummariensis]PRY11640.1 LEA14-like dessication related protein [Pontibacter ummariensis]SNS64080.1 LEA14-like dessication related protein [Pontibacter ummariensis]
MNDKAKWTIIILVLLALLGGALYFILKKKYYPKVEDIAYLKLDIANDTAQVKAGVQVQNRLPLSIAIDSVHYTIVEDSITLGRGQMTTSHTLPALGDKVLDFRMLLDFEKYRQHLKEQQEKDSLKLAVKSDIFFDLPLISSKSISLTRHITVPVPKGPRIQLQDVVVRSFSPDAGYSFLLKVNATNRDLPNLTIQDFDYEIQIGDTLRVAGTVDTTFHLQRGGKLLDIPIQLETSDAIALIKKVLSEDDKWNYSAQVGAQIQSSHRLLDEFRLTVEKEGTLNMDQMGSRADYLPSISQVRRIEVDSDEEQTFLQANVVVHNPAPIPLYIDSATYYVRHNGKVIASGKKDFEQVLPKSGKQPLNLRLLLDESAYQQLMQNVQGQEKVSLDIALNLLYNLPDAERQRIHLERQLQVPVAGQGGIKVAGLAVRELSPQKGAYLTLKLKVQRSNLPDLSIHDLDYTLQLGEDLVITGHTQEPTQVSETDSIVEVPLHLTTENVNQLLEKALKGTINWNYKLQASAQLRSSNDILGPTRLSFESEGELDWDKGAGGKEFVPQITSIDTLKVFIHYDTAWVKLHINVRNPLPVAFRVDSLLLTLSYANDTVAISRESIDKVLPAEDTTSAWITLGVNYDLWQQYLQQYGSQDSLRLMETVSLVYRLEDLPQQRTTFYNMFRLPMSDKAVVALKKVKPRGFSFTKGILMAALVEVNNLNMKQLVVSDITYDACVENLLDACGTINRAYHIPKGNNIVSVPLHLGIGEAFRALFAKLTGGSKRRNVILNATATIDTSNPKLQDTFVWLEVWQRMKLFQNKQKEQETQNPPAATATN